MEKLLEELVVSNKKFTSRGKVADYIPALAKANIANLGISIKTKEGLYFAGDYLEKFTIQSISKVFSLIIALIENGEEYVFDRVGRRGTDEAFNTMYKLDLDEGSIPANPMINSGAILTTSLIKGSGEEKYEKVLRLLKIASKNNDLKLNEEVYLSEKETGDKNKAMAYLLKNKNLLEGSVDESLDAYFKQCSIEVNSKDLANLALFLASGFPGIKDFGRIEKDRLKSIVLGIMLTAGMYDFSTEYAINIGIPSKSGVGGGIMAVSKDMGIGVFSPGLDGNGNSLAGQKLLEDLSKKLNLNILL